MLKGNASLGCKYWMRRVGAKAIRRCSDTGASGRRCDSRVFRIVALWVGIEIAGRCKGDQMSEELTEEEKRVRKAEVDAKIAEAKAKEEAAKQKLKEQKARGRERAASKVKKVPKKIKLILALISAVVVVLAVAFVPGIISSFGKGTTVSEASLKKAVEISKLSTAEFSYNGIAEKVDENGDVSYYIYYEASADAGVDMEQIRFKVDQTQKTITVVLPSITVDDPIIDESAIECLPHDANIDLREVLEICKQDVQREISESTNIKKIAIGNIKSTLEALMLPLIGDEGYKIYWEDEVESDKTTGSDDAGDENEVD